jgi:hypothetical protein
MVHLLRDLMSAGLTSEQQQWLDKIRAHVIENLSISKDDFEIIPIFSNEGRGGRANRVVTGIFPHRSTRGMRRSPRNRGSDILVDRAPVIDGDDKDHKDTVLDRQDCPVRSDAKREERDLFVTFQFLDAGLGILFCGKFV